MGKLRLRYMCRHYTAETHFFFHIGTSLRELLQKFRSKTLTLVKLLLLEKKVYDMLYCRRAPVISSINPPVQILFYGYPVERLCTFQYSLISLIPGSIEKFATPHNVISY